ncbi:MAG: pre-peptidase C-terminal domain-containing protein, partial [Pirellulales bacterium]
PTPISAQVLTGAYQLEVRRGAEYAVVLNEITGLIGLTSSFDTNDRLTQDFSLTIPDGSALREGQTFQINDGVNVVTFEFDSDGLLADPQFANTLVPFTVNSTGAFLAAQIVALINANPILTTTASSIISGNRVDLFGAAFVASGAAGATTTLNESPATQDTIGTALSSGLSSTSPGKFVATGNIGDNPNLIANGTADVDMISFDLTAGDRARIDIDARLLGSPLDSVLRVFDAFGNQLAFSDDNQAPGEVFTFDSYIEFVAAVSGVYYVGVSGFANFSYDPFTEGSGTVNAPFSLGDYTIEITIGSGVVEFDQFDVRGDDNQFREQGQLLIQANRISGFAQFGVRVDASARDPLGNLPHQGAVRNLQELNTSRLAPGVSIINNLITGVGQTGILVSGDPNAANQPLSAVPYVRVVNNTIYGSAEPAGTGILVTDNASPTILNNIVANLTTGISVDATSQAAGTILTGTLYRNAPTTAANTGASNGGLGDFAISLTNLDPLFESESTGVFSLAKGSQAIDSSIDSLQDRP